jgi:hypothetical protein
VGAQRPVAALETVEVVGRLLGDRGRHEPPRQLGRQAAPELGEREPGSQPALPRADVQRVLDPPQIGVAALAVGHRDRRDADETADRLAVLGLQRHGPAWPGARLRVLGPRPAVGLGEGDQRLVDA